MEIYVTDPDGKEFIGNSREELADHLYRTASDEYTDAVLTWFDVDPRKPLPMRNGSETETWEVHAK